MSEINNLTGFDNVKNDSDNEDESLENIRKPKNKRSGGFQSMGLSFEILKGITKRGYKIPTPIQRKTIPLALEGRDVVAMARTGSGKTACFLIPMFAKLKARSAKAGARAIILSPTRELALQTLKFCKQLGKFMDLKYEVIIGGDSMESQFSAIHGNPDVIIATPGRFLHVCVEMDLKLNSIEYVVFDEADRLFEMGFGEQLNNILERLPDSRQTLLFSATLPKVLVQFAKAGLNDPVLIRLDLEAKLPERLELFFIVVRQEQSTAALLALLKSHIQDGQQTVIFAATKHHVEYLHMLLDCLQISNSYVYSDLDASARKINVAKFNQRKVSILVVTDVAARGLDIPELDNVINYNFPAKSKLFIHRVGRTARAGCSGTAYSLVTNDELPFLIDLHLFLGKPLELIGLESSKGNIGRMPQDLVEEYHSTILTLHKSNFDLENAKKVMENGYKQYLKSRPLASIESNRRVKEISFQSIGIHSIFKSNQSVEDRERFLESMKSYRPQGTIFEICSKNNSQDYKVMKEKRAFHKTAIENYHVKVEKRKRENEISETSCSLEASSAGDIKGTFDEVVFPKKRRIDDLYKKRRMPYVRDDNYVPYESADKHTENGMAIDGFERDANKYQIDLLGDSTEAFRGNKQRMQWDRKKKKMVGVKNAKEGKIKTESGNWISSSYKGNKYKQWKDHLKIAGNNDSDEDQQVKKDIRKRHTHWENHNSKVKNKKIKSQTRNTEQIMKIRKIAEKKKARQNKKLRTKKKK